MNGRPGINLVNALRKIFTELDGRDDPVLQEAAGAISCRLLVGLQPLIRPLSLIPPSFPGTQPTIHARYVRRTNHTTKY